MTRDEIVAALRGDCKDCVETVTCKRGVSLIGMYCPNADAADLIENQQHHIAALMQANAALRDTILRRDKEIAEMKEVNP